MVNYWLVSQVNGCVYKSNSEGYTLRCLQFELWK